MRTCEYDSLIYLKSNFHPRDLVDGAIEVVSTKLARIETGGTEINIPENGRLVLGFMPHNGILETELVDKFLLKRGRSPAIWVTKKETQELPEFVLSYRRLIYVDRENPGPSTFRAANMVLDTPNGTIGSALEGTRFSNPNDPKDVLTLGQAKPGLMSLSLEKDAPIMGVVVLGVDKILHDLDKILKEKGYIEALRCIAMGFKNPKDVQLRFLPVYRDHLTQEGRGLKGKEKQQYIKMHNDIFTHQLIEEIIKLKPDYPLGYYEEISSKPAPG